MSQTKSDLVPGLEIMIESVKAGQEGGVTIYDVTLTCGQGMWCDSWGTEGELKAYLRGLEAAGMMIAGKHVQRPEIPRSPL